MEKQNYIFGPIPSRRLGRSLGISPIPKKICNYSCVYCQLGRTDKMTNTRKEYFPIEDIIFQLKSYLSKSDEFDVISIVGEGEPTLYSKLGELIIKIKEVVNKPVAVITNSALLYDKDVRQELMNADIVLPSVDAYNEDIYKKIDRPFGKLDFKSEIDGLIQFSKSYSGQLWLELMLIKNINSSESDIDNFKILLDKIRHDRVYINTPVRPPAEEYVEIATPEQISYAVETLNGISIDHLTSGNFYSGISDNYDAILNIIGRHPMTQFEIESLLKSRNETNIQNIFDRLTRDINVQHINYKGIVTYRLK